MDIGDSILLFAGQLSAEHLLLGSFTDATLLDALPPVDACFVMPGRLKEIPRAQATAVVDYLKTRTGCVVIYAFDDWLGHASVVELAVSVGLTPREVPFHRRGVARMLLS